MDDKLIFEKSRAGRSAISLQPLDVDRKEIADMIPDRLLRARPPELPEIAELDLVRHYVGLSRKNMGIDTNFYPLGSCTMKYNPRINEKGAQMSGILRTHPYQPAATIGGLLTMLAELEGFLREIAGMDAVSLQPAAGAHGEYTGLLVTRAYHRARGDAEKTEVLIPDSAHGTNPASSALCGYRCVQIMSDKRGCVDLADFKKKVSRKTAAVMITNPNTLGLFEEEIEEIAGIVHENGGVVYMDGANLNAIAGVVRPGDFGVDILHINLHKTFSTPHGGGGPGAGPIGVKKALEPFLPVPRIVERDGAHTISFDFPRSIGRVRTFFGNVGILLRAYIYILAHGEEGIRNNSRNAVLNANYLAVKLKKAYALPHDRLCMHEFVLSASRQRKLGIRALDVAKRLLDFGFHPPTIYFPLIVPEALMIEPTETESRETLDAFVDAMLKIDEECRTDPDVIHQAPHTQSVGRLDEVTAAREPVLRYRRN